MRWLVTGCSSGLGLELARAILASGERCIATSRNPSNTPDAVAEIEKLGGIWAQLDVASPDLEQQFEDIVQKHGDINVLVNNAGYAIGSVIETLPLEAARALYETNFFGPIRTIQAVLPSMREKKSGTIVNVSSSEFWFPHPVASLYASSKFALEGISEALQTEVSPFNIRVLLAQPGGMRTNFLDPKKVSSLMTPLPEGYKGTISEHAINAILATHGTQNLDPKKSAEAVVNEVLHPSSNPPILRMPLGKESLDKMKEKIDRNTNEAKQCEEMAVACDY